MQEHRRTLLWLGAFTLLSIVALTYLAFRVGSFNIGGGREYRVLFASSVGIPDNADVRVAGILVGRVRRMDIAPEGGAAVWIAVTRNDQEVFDDASAVIKAKSLLGERFIELRPGRSGVPLPPGSDITKTITPFRIEDLGELIGPLVAELEDVEIQASLADLIELLTENQDGLIHTARQLGETVDLVNQLLRDNHPQLTLALKHADQLMRRIDRLLRTNETELQTGLREASAMLVELRGLSGELRGALAAYPSAGTDAVELLARFNRLAGRLEGADLWKALLIVKKILQEEGVNVNLIGDSARKLDAHIEEYRELLRSPEPAGR